MEPNVNDDNFCFEGDIHLTQNHSNSNLRRDCTTVCHTIQSHNAQVKRESSPPPSYPSIDKGNQKFTLLSPDRTVAETVESSNWSIDDGVIGRHGRGGSHANGDCNPLNKTMAPLTLWNIKCFFNPYDLLGLCLECFGLGETPKRRIPSVGDGLSTSHSNDCFVRVDCSTTTDTATTRFIESDYSWNDSYYYPYASIDQVGTSDRFMVEEVDNEGGAEEAEPMPNELDTQQINKQARSLQSRMTFPPPQIRQVSNGDQKLTPISEHTKAAKYDAYSSLNTLHRRNDHYSVSFFTSETLDAIHTSPSNADSITPRDQASGASARHNPDYKTPPNRARADSDTFRRTIQVVTCEKRGRGDDISPIPMDTPRFDNATPRRQNEEHQNAGEQTASDKNMRSVNLYEEEFMIDIMNSNNHESEFIVSEQCHLDEMMEEEEMTQCNDAGSVLLWPDTYLQKSPSYIKALRKAGRKGKCLIQGWVAFRQDQGSSWNETIRNPRRSDFRYIILLDDMPLLHIFPSRSKTKKEEPKKNVLDDCITFDLSSDIGFEVQLASQELGNEICVFDADTGAFFCSFLPISMPADAFQDKHRSRLAKSVILTNVFGSYCQNAILPYFPLDELEKAIVEPLQYSKQIYAPREQYDVSRHLIFVLDAARWSS